MTEHEKDCMCHLCLPGSIQQTNEKQKIELNWPDDVNYTNWESTIIQDKLIAFVSFHYDTDPINPCKDWDGFGEIRSLSLKHIDNIDRDEANELLKEDNDHVVSLSYFEHGRCKWDVMGTMNSMPDFNWDGVEFAGIWIGDKECIATVDIEEKEATGYVKFNRKERFIEMAKQACKTYTDYCNGEVYGYDIKLYRLQFDDDLEPIEEHGNYEHLDQLFENSCWGYYGNDMDFMKEDIKNNLKFYLDSMKEKSQFNSKGEPDLNKMSQEDFNRILVTLIKRDASTLLLIPGLYEVVSEHYNNEVLEEWEKEQLE